MRSVLVTALVWLTVGVSAASAGETWECTGKVEIGYMGRDGFVSKQTMKTRTANFTFEQSNANEWTMDGDLKCKVGQRVATCSDRTMLLQVDLQERSYTLSEDIGWFDDEDEPGDDHATTYMSHGFCVVKPASQS